ncbi:MAG TPA: 23S rRNA (uracil(1939)-C(5))-methyltransferase RlmD [Candidatus Binatia bacterium]|nr:23S rRNA (uracil(1939)-C(5))-methyltransferase RlmD [Candidatus Binatia bacterium]
MDELTVTIDSLAYGIFGVARTDRGIVFVPGVAPGEVARVRIIEEKRDYREAELLEILEPSPVRRIPPCPYVPECGGCAWQHLDYPAQLEAKESILRHTIARIGGLDGASLDVRPILASPQWAYRHRLTLRVDGEQRLGFYRHRSHRLIEIARCRIADEAVNAHLDVAREWLRGVSTTVRRLEIASARDRRVVFVGNAEGAFRHDDVYHEKFLRAHPTVGGIVLFGRGWRRMFGKPVVDLEIDGDLILESQGGFTQVNPEANRRLVETVLDLAAPSERDRVLDLYCGAGNFTLPLARRVREVVGVEVDPASVGKARRNADRARLTNCRFVERESAAAARGLAASGDRFSLVILDPPRSGAANVVEHLAALASDRLVFVSCNPATLARDLRHLTRLGFALGPIQPVDLFPQTYHVEAVVRVDRVAEPSALPAAGNR